MWFLIDAHVDYTDAYTYSCDFTKELVHKHPNGKLKINGRGLGEKRTIFAWNTRGINRFLLKSKKLVNSVLKVVCSMTFLVPFTLTDVATQNIQLIVQSKVK